MCCCPTELPDLRLRMIGAMGSPEGHRTMRILAGTVSETGVEELLAADASAFESAQLLHVAPDLVDLLLAAREGMGPAGLMDYDLPFLSGMAYLAKKIPAYEQRKSLLSRVAQMRADFDLHAADLDPADRAEIEEVLFSQERRVRDMQLEKIAQMNWDEHLLALWSWAAPTPSHPHGSIRVSWYLERDAWWEWSRQLSLAVSGRDIVPEGRPQLPPFVFEGHVIISCSPEAAEVRVQRFDGKDVGPDPDSDWRTRRVDLFRALVYLLRQDNVIAAREERPSRPARRRAAREGREAPSVRVLALRGVSSGGGGSGESGREYAHRWVVRGHWRRQWYPSIGQHRPRFIAPFIKGPEDAPLLGGEKVYTAKRPVG